jgi:hypothetical protein
MTAGAALPAAAQVRTEPSAASLVNPANAEAGPLFERSGLFMIAGGVIPSGSTTFLLEQNGTQTPVAAAAVTLVAQPDGSTALQTGGHTYHVAMPAGLGCPLGEFTARDGEIAYTVPKYVDPDSRIAMIHAGLVNRSVAREFADTPFVPLLKAADTGAAEPLPPAIEQRIVASINGANEVSNLVLQASDDVNSMIGSYINSGLQVTYRVDLQPASSSVEIGGVPLRYFWKLETSGAAGVFSVEIYSQNWRPNAHLSAPGAAPTQYDVVNFYQVAALFHQLHETNPAAFTSFVDKVCNRAI